MKIPIIKFHGNLIVSIQTALSDSLVQQLKDDIMASIDKTGAAGLVMDVSGVDLMDSYISRSIRDISLMAKLMGVKTVISGMDPMVAITLVEMGMNMEGVETCMNLEAAIDYLDELEEGGAEQADEEDMDAEAADR